MFAPSRTCALLFLDTARRSQRCSSSVEAVAKPLRTRPRISFIPLRRSNSAVFSPAAASKALSDRALLRPVLLMIKSAFAIFLACSRHAGEACSPQ